MKKWINEINEMFYNEEGAGIVEYGLLIGTLGFAMFEIWSQVRWSLVVSYGNILRTIRDMKYP